MTFFFFFSDDEFSSKLDFLWFYYESSACDPNMTLGSSEGQKALNWFSSELHGLSPLVLPVAQRTLGEKDCFVFGASFFVHSVDVLGNQTLHDGSFWLQDLEQQHKQMFWTDSEAKWEQCYSINYTFNKSYRWFFFVALMGSNWGPVRL